MDQVRFEMRRSVGRIVLAAPPGNAINRKFVDALHDAVHQASLSEARVLMISSEGPNFGTGGDIAEWPEKNSRWFTTFIADVNSIYRAIEALRVPTIAVVQGNCVSGHYELALHCDLILASEDATFSWIEAKAAMAPLAGGLQRLAQRIGRGRAIGHVMLGETLNASQAAALGIVTRISSTSRLQIEAGELADALADGPTRAFGAMRALAKAWGTGGTAAADELMLDLTMDLFDSVDGKNAFRRLAAAVVSGAELPSLVFVGH